jgi:phosphoribosylanthranilate isomerase
MFKRESGAEGRLRIKICGITNTVDALAAIDCGADALGFNFVPRSKRYLDINFAADWMATLPARAVRVAILADPSLEEAIRMAERPFIDALQLHGNEPPALCQRLAECGIQFAKAIPVSNQASLQNAASFHTPTIVLDSTSEGQFGGSGRPFPWELARQFARAQPALKIVLAGGLTPENVGSAVAEARPFGVDVTTGVESSPGRKDHARMRAFIDAALRAWR